MLTPSLARSTAKTHVDFISGPVRIKDALYMGDEIAAKDMDFIASNKVTHIINTVVKRVPNLYQKYGVQYLSVNWTQKQTNIFDKKNNAINMIFTFIEQAMEQGESVLVHSLHGKSRAGCVIIAYLMKKFSWSLQKTFDYVVSKKESFKIRSQFLSQLQQLQKRLAQNSKLSSSWNVSCHEEDLILANTFKNTKIEAIFQKTQAKQTKKKVSWGQKLNDTFSRPSHNILTSTTKYKEYLQQFGIKPVKLKSILKNCNDGTQKQQQTVSNEEDSIQKIDASPVLKNQTKEMEKSKKFQEQRLTKSQAIGNNKISNQSYVIVNNFMSNQKQKNDRYASIQSRQQKQKQKKLQSRSGSRLAPYQNIISTIKSPYDINFMNRIGENSKPRRRQDHHQHVKGNAQERPYSVNDENPRGNSVRVSSSRNSNRQQQTYGNFNNRNWPSQRQNIIRYK